MAGLDEEKRQLREQSNVKLPLALVGALQAPKPQMAIGGMVQMPRQAPLPKIKLPCRGIPYMEDGTQGKVRRQAGSSWLHRRPEDEKEGEGTAYESFWAETRATTGDCGARAWSGDPGSGRRQGDGLPRR